MKEMGEIRAEGADRCSFAEWPQQSSAQASERLVRMALALLEYRCTCRKSWSRGAWKCSCWVADWLVEPCNIGYDGDVRTAKCSRTTKALKYTQARNPVAIVLAQCDIEPQAPIPSLIKTRMKWLPRSLGVSSSCHMSFFATADKNARASAQDREPYSGYSFTQEYQTNRVVAKTTDREDTNKEMVCRHGCCWENVPELISTRCWFEHMVRVSSTRPSFTETAIAVAITTCWLGNMSPTYCMRACARRIRDAERLHHTHTHTHTKE